MERPTLPVEEPIKKPEVSESGFDMEAILKAQQMEKEWYATILPFDSEADVLEALEIGMLQAVPDVSEGATYKVSKNCTAGPENCFRSLTPNAKALLDRIAGMWRERMSALGAEYATMSLIVTSLTRDKNLQARLQGEGNPAAPEDTSTHLRGGAFDIALDWFDKNNKPEVSKIFQGVIEELSAEGIMSSIDEVGAFHIRHIAVDPYRSLRHVLHW